MTDVKPRANQRDIFWHLLGMGTLYVSAIALTTVLFQIVNILIPDPILAGGGYGYADSAKRLLRMAVSALVIMFPVCVYALKQIQESYEKEKEKRELRIRKSIIYFTLFVVSFIIMFTLVFLINRFLSGELTTRFFLKLVSTLLVAGSVFGYYRWDLHRFDHKKV